MQTPNASSAAEARWGFAFWLQNETGTIGGDEDGDLQAWFDAEADAFPDEEERLEALSSAFMESVADAVRRLHDEGVVAQVFGKAVPVIVHEYEWYDLPLEWTKRANPEALLVGFMAAYENNDI